MTTELKTANNFEFTLYCLTGEALWFIQNVEQALSHLITLKLFPKASLDVAIENLQQHQRYTLGKAINIANSNKLIGEELQLKLDSFLSKRNWLVHNALIDYHKNIVNVEQHDVYINSLLNKIKLITTESISIQKEIEISMVQFVAEQRNCNNN